VKTLSVDPGEYGNDPTAYLYRAGNIVTELKRAYKQSLMQTAASIQIEVSNGLQIVIDTLGVGAGVGSRLDELGVPFMHYRGGSGSKIKDSTGNFGFDNVRSAAYWKVREALNPEGEILLRVPPDDDLTADLTAIDYKIVTGTPPKIKITTKEEVKKKLGRSPDYGDALAMSIYHYNTTIADGDSASISEVESEGVKTVKVEQPKQTVRGSYTERQPSTQRKSLIFG